jgi:hypothetical protein
MMKITVYYGDVSEIGMDEVIDLEQRAYDSIKKQCSGVADETYSSDSCTDARFPGQCYYATVYVEYVLGDLNLPDEVLGYEVEEVEGD